MEPEENSPLNNEAMHKLKHDIRNQLSGMILCIEQLRYEITDPLPDWKYYMDSISDACGNINEILDKVE